MHIDVLQDNLKDNKLKMTCAQIGDQYEDGSYRN